MSNRALFILVLVLALLVALVALRQRSENTAPLAEDSAPIPGELAFPELDVNAITRVEISSGEEQAAVERGPEGWVVASHYNYPADFNKLADLLRAFTDLKVSQVVPDGIGYLDEFGLAEADDPMRLTLVETDKSYNLLVGEIKSSSGSSPMGFSGFGFGRYARIGDGPVLLLDNALNALNANSESWLDKELLSVQASSIVEVRLAGEEQAKDILRMPSSGQYEMENLAEDEELDTSAASRLAGALSNLRFSRIESPKSNNDWTTGDEVRTIEFMDHEGFVYRTVCGPVDTADSTCLLSLSVRFEETPAPTRETVMATLIQQENEQADAYEQRLEQALNQRIEEHTKQMAERQERAVDLNGRFAPWTFRITSWNGEPLRLSRADLVKTIETTPDEEEE